jgi:hypothetical protein
MHGVSSISRLSDNSGGGGGVEAVRKMNESLKQCRALQKCMLHSKQ